MLLVPTVYIGATLGTSAASFGWDVLFALAWGALAAALLIHLGLLATFVTADRLRARDRRLRRGAGRRPAFGGNAVESPVRRYS
jgi:hypothetical protein